MNAITTFLIAICITLAVSAGVVLFIRRHLRNVLVDLTGTESRAGFWTAFTSLMLILVPAIVAMFVPRTSHAEEPVFFQVTAVLRWSLIGLVATLVSYGFIIIWFVQTRLRHAPQWPQPYQQAPVQGQDPRYAASPQAHVGIEPPHNPPMQRTATASNGAVE